MSNSYIQVDLEQGSAEWKKWRCEGIGASDAPVIMNENPWKSPEELLREKLGRSEEEPENENMRRGIALEPEARRKYCQKVGISVTPACLQSKDYSWARASLDGISADRKKVVEIKCGKSSYNKAREGIVPGYYFGQLQHILFVTGIESIDYWCYQEGDDGILIEVKRDEEYIGHLVEAENEFMQDLSKREHH